MKKLNKKVKAVSYQVEIKSIGNNQNGENIVLSASTACKTFGSCIIDTDGNFIYTDGMSKCKSCKADTKSACIAKLAPEFKFAGKKSGNGISKGTGTKAYFFPADSTQAYMIDTMLADGIISIAEIAKQTGLPKTRVSRRITAIKKRPGSEIYFAASNAI